MIAQTTDAAIATPGMWYMVPILVFAVGMLVWDTVEVGRNDAANLINAVYGARLMTRRRAVLLAGLAVIIGAMLSEGVMETARKGIFDPGMLGLKEAIAIYVSVYVVDTVLLYGYSAYGMPVSTTACLVFELLGASFAMSLLASARGDGTVVQWGTAGKVVSAIVISIFLAGFCSYIIQRIVRGVIRDRTSDLVTMRLHGTWIGGGMATGLTFFLLLKGMKKVPVIKYLRDSISDFDMWLKSLVLSPSTEATADFNYGMLVMVCGLWIFYALIIAVLLQKYRHRAARQVFPTIAIVGMIAMAIAFGQNDLANCASPGLATINLLWNWEKGTAAATNVPIAGWMLFVCGVLLFLGMRTKNAARVTKAGVNMGSHADHVRLYAPAWCLWMARLVTRRRSRMSSLAPEPAASARGKSLHFDTLRACTIMGVSASVIALASSYKLPVSTTYVAFAAIVGSGMGDRIYQRGDAALKIARSIWVVFSWFLAAGIAAFFTGIVCAVVFFAGVFGLIGMLGVNLYLRKEFKRRGDAQAARTREELMERWNPEQYASEYE